MPYAIPERIYRAYQSVIDFYKTIRERIPNPEELLMFGERGDDSIAVYIRRPGIVVDWFKNHFEGLKQNAVRVTPQNFHILFPPNQSVQLSLDLEGRLGKESSPNNPT